jgi:hypothetical protein
MSHTGLLLKIVRTYSGCFTLGLGQDDVQEVGRCGHRRNGFESTGRHRAASRGQRSKQRAKIILSREVRMKEISDRLSHGSASPVTVGSFLLPSWLWIMLSWVS